MCLGAKRIFSVQSSCVRKSTLNKIINFVAFQRSMNAGNFSPYLHDEGHEGVLGIDRLVVSLVPWVRPSAFCQQTYKFIGAVQESVHITNLAIAVTFCERYIGRVCMVSCDWFGLACLLYS